ncbi:hypothetical protein EsVE80_07290 [Enterococcus saigonensis]|uniref:Mga helix-turn-helix domain-containing protein n=1 Tax=Enterococcus saigonensis TaxID=1805431 RepID=A0A679IJ34_9ENTE|nr:helix-turn-helix domain-containing protein [Enterococcus saigonensis]BCA85206.1 hypothetical protein EsVE80_07290 [Enterococcus saigonensis]
MQTFLTKTSQKKIRMFNFLLEEKKWRTIKEIQDLLELSAKSIILYAEELEHLFKKYNGQIELKNENNQRFFLFKEEDFPIYNIYLHYYYQSYNYYLIDFIYHNPYKNLEDFADKQFTSVSTVFRYAKLLVPYFKRCKIKFHPFALELDANEANIRAFFYYFYWNSTRRGGWPFKSSQKKILKYVSQFEKVYKISLLSLQKRIFSYWLAIILDRFTIYPVKLDTHTEKIAAADENFSLVNIWLSQCDLVFPIPEQLFLYQVLYSFGVIDGNRLYEKSHAKAHQLNNSTSYAAVTNLQRVIQDDFQFKLDTKDSELLFNFIAFHERSQLFFGNTDVFFNYSFIKKLQRQQKEVAHIILDFYRHLQLVAPENVRQLLKNKEQLFLSYYYILDYYDLPLKKQEPIKILIADDLHHTHRLWLMNKVKNYFGNAYPLSFYDYELDVSRADLVISNYYFDTDQTPLLLMKNFPTERNWRTLEKLLYKISHKKQAEQTYK